jgi:hypothetical protein
VLWLCAGDAGIAPVSTAVDVYWHPSIVDHSHDDDRPDAGSPTLPTGIADDPALPTRLGRRGAGSARLARWLAGRLTGWLGGRLAG